MKAYSMDFRKRVLAVIQSDSMTQEEIMEYFGVSATFIYTLKKRFEKTGSVEAKPHGGGMPAKFSGRSLELMKRFVERHPDATLQEILDHTGKKASIMAVSRALDRLGFHRKKSRYGQLSKIGQT